MAEKTYTPDGKEYDPKQKYALVDKDGNIKTYSYGDNGYVWQAVTNGVSVSINDKGEWYVDPYLEVKPDGVVAHMPSWFRGTPEYTEWKNTYDSYITPDINADTFNKLNKILNSYGSSGALRVALYQQAQSNGITDKTLKNNYRDNLINLYVEGNTKTSQPITLYGQKYDSAAEVARDFKNMSKEDLSRVMTNMYNTLQQGKSNYTKNGELSYEEQENIYNALVISKILNHIDDNYSTFGDGKEFEGLLQASAAQKFNALVNADMGALGKSVFGLPARLFRGVAYLIKEGKFDTDITKDAEKNIMSASSGYGLEGTEGFIQVGGYIGSAEALVGTVGLMMLTGQVRTGLADKMAGSNSAFLQALGGFAKTNVGGVLITDFAFNDLPMDVLNFFTAWSEKDLGRAFYDANDSQPFLPIPFIGDKVSPQVPTGFWMDLAGDITLDFGAYALGAGLKYFNAQLDDITNGTITRIKEWTAVKNLQLQQKLTDIPVVGTGWKKIMNAFMGAENAEYIRMARKQAIAEGTMDPYVRAHNNLTLKNHGGAEAVLGGYRILKDQMGYDSTIKNFQKSAKKYGGTGSTKVEWQNTKNAKIKKYSRTVPDVVPTQVKQGLLDVERLAELKGQMAKTGGLVQDAAMMKEIEELEAKVAALPQDIKAFADKFSDLNKQVEALGVKLGVTNEEWLNAMLMDPQFEKYMVRQALTPMQRDRVGSAEAPAILNKGRKGYYAENYIDPVIALDMKVDALGRAYAWNLQAEHVAAMQIAQGQVLAGKSGAKAAERMAEVKKEIAGVKATRDKLGYDATLKDINKQAQGIERSIREINELLNAPERISLKSIYSAEVPPVITEMLEDFNSGKIKFADGAAAKAGLSDGDAELMVRNTYSYTTVTNDGKEALNIAKADNANELATARTGKVYNAGVAADGTAYRYEIEDGEIKNIREISDAPAMAETIKRLGGVYDVDSATIEKIGVENARALNRTLLYYKNNMPTMPDGSTFRCTAYPNPKKRDRVYGWIPSVADEAEYKYRVENGRIAATFPVYTNEVFYSKGQEARTAASIRTDVADRYHPKNSEGLENVWIHENGHSTMARLCVARLNEKIDSGEIKLREGISSEDIGWMVYQEWNKLNHELVERAFAKMGITYGSEREFKRLWQQMAYDDISKYAGSVGKDGTPSYQWETFSEAQVDFWANSDTASRFSVAIVEEMRIESQKFTKATSPRKVFADNGLPTKGGLFKGDNYNFPANVKTNKQKAKWLDKQRRLNPFLDPDFGPKGVFTTDQYIKANMWDTFFKKEIDSYDPSFKTSIPDALVAKNGEFLDDLSKNAAKKLVQKIKEASPDAAEGFDKNLAMVALGRTPSDTTEALDNYIISRVNNAAQKIAEKMEGGATEANINKARITLWQDDNIKSDMVKILEAFTPDLSATDVRTKIDTLFNEQATGLAAVDELPVHYGTLNQEYKDLSEELYRSNKYAMGKGKEVDKALKEKGFTDDTTQVIHYMKGGEDVYVVVKDPVVASILKNPGNYAKNGLVPEGLTQAANVIASRYRLGTTGMSIPALVRNFLRDPVQAWVSNGSNPLTMMIDPMSFYSTLRQYGLDDVTIKNVTIKIREWASTGTLTSELRKAGGGTASSRGYSNNAERFVKWYNNNILDGKLYRTAGAPLEAWESMFRNQVGQQSFLKAMRSNGGDIDKSLARSMFDTSNATTNFSHSIYFLNRLVGTVPYLSSGINGVASFWRMFNVDPIGVTCRITSGFIVPAMALTTWNLSDDDRREAYMNLPEWYRSQHIVLVADDGSIFSIPLPEELDSFYNTTRRLIEYTNDSSPKSLQAIMLQGAFGFLPGDTDGFVNDDGSLNFEKGFKQYLSGFVPQAVSAAYEMWAEYNTFSDYSTSNFEWWNKMIYDLGNVFGSSFVNIVNDIGFMAGATKKTLYGNTTVDTLSRDLFGMGFNDAKNQFMELIGNPSSKDWETGKETKATGLFKESEELQQKIKNIDKEIAMSSEDKKNELEEKRQKMIEDFGERVKNLTNKYMQLYTSVGGLEDWQRKKLIQILSLGESTSAGAEGSYQRGASQESSLDEYSLGRQRYTELGLPSGPTIGSLGTKENGDLIGSIDLQAAIDSFYGAPKQATQDYKNAIEQSKLKDIRNEFYDAVSKIYDIAEEAGEKPDYDMIEKLQARYLQAVDAVLIPIINQYGVSILNNNDFVDQVRRQVNGMIPSDDWRQSVRNAKKFLSTKDFPTATVDVKKWLKERYTSELKNRNLDSDPEVTQKLNQIKSMIDRGEKNAAKGVIEDLLSGINKANYYISSDDYYKLRDYSNMVK